MASLPAEERVPRFDGPLDFFLEALRQQNIPIPELRLAPLIEQYLAYVRQAAGRDLGLQMEWIEMAALLIRWKSRTLLPRTAVQQQEDEELRAGLIAQLLARAQEGAGELARRRERENASWTQSTPAAFQETALPDGEYEEPEPFFSAWDCIREANELRAWVLAYREEARERERNAYSVTDDQSTVDEMMEWATERLRDAPPGEWRSADPLFSDAGSLPRQCSLFLALLELTHTGDLQVKQEEEFETIYVSPIGATAT